MDEKLIKSKLLEIEKKIKSYNIQNIALYGTGQHTKKILNFLDDSFKSKIVGLIDKDERKIDSTFYGYKVYDLNFIKNKVDAIIISSDVYQDIIYDRIAYLKEQDIKIIKMYDEDYFLPTISNVVYENINSKYRVEQLDEQEYELWNKFVDQSPQGSIFNKTWYLKAVQTPFKIFICIDKNNDILGGMVIPRLIDDYIAMPMLTQTLGILLRDLSNMKYVNRISKEKDIIESLVNAVPNFKYYSINFNYNFTNWLPFMWKGYNQYCKYTYVIEDLSNLDRIKNNMRDNIKYDINKAIKNDIKIYEDLPIEELYKVYTKTFTRQGLNVPINLKSIKYFDEILKERKASKSFFAMDKRNDIHSSNYIIYDNKSAYYLLGGGEPKLRSSGATSLALWEAIKFSSKVTKRFDFEGSCLRNIEEFFRGFGGAQRQYFNIWKRKVL